MLAYVSVASSVKEHLTFERGGQTSKCTTMFEECDNFWLPFMHCPLTQLGYNVVPCLVLHVVGSVYIRVCTYYSLVLKLGCLLLHVQLY